MYFFIKCQYEDMLHWWFHQEMSCNEPVEEVWKEGLGDHSDCQGASWVDGEEVGLQLLYPVRLQDLHCRLKHGGVGKFEVTANREFWFNYICLD